MKIINIVHIDRYKYFNNSKAFGHRQQHTEAMGQAKPAGPSKPYILADTQAIIAKISTKHRM